MTGQSFEDLASKLSLRAVKWEDLEPVVQLIYDVCDAEGDTSVAVTVDDLKNEWEYEGFDPQQDAFVVETADGLAVGYAALFDMKEHCDLSGDIYIHPQFKGQGIGAALLAAMEFRGQDHVKQAPTRKRVFIRAALDNKDEQGKAVFGQAAYEPVRYHWRMEIVLDDAPPTPDLPAGLEIRPFVEADHARAVWQARNEAFAGNWGSHELTFEQFSYYNIDTPEYDPSLWTVIWDGDDVVAFSINHMRMGIGWLHTLGVRPAWRKQGLGQALMQLSFRDFFQRGVKTIGLGVDASNPTGATELYKKVGMHVVSEFVSYERELRAGE